MINLKVEGNSVTIDDNLTVQSAPDGNGYTLSYPDAYGTFALRPKSPPPLTHTYKKMTGVEYDSAYYRNGHNGYTVDESVESAMQRLWEEIIPPHIMPQDNESEWDSLEEDVTKMIRNGQGRQAVYALAGGIIKGYKEGKYKGVPFSWVFKGFVDGVIEKEETPKATVGWVEPTYGNVIGKRQMW